MHTTASETSEQPRGKKKNHNRLKKKYFVEPTSQTNQENIVRGSQSKRKYKYPCMVCQEYHMTKDCPRLNDVRNYIKQGQPSSKPAINPFPALQQMVAQAPAPPFRGASSSSATILMADVVIGIST